MADDLYYVHSLPETEDLESKCIVLCFLHVQSDMVRDIRHSCSGPVRVTFCRGTSTRDEVEYVDVAINAVCAHEDREVVAVVGCCDAATTYDPPVEAVPVAPLPVDDESESAATDFAPPGLRSPVSSGSVVGPPDDFTVDGSLTVRSASEAAISTSDVDPEETSLSTIVRYSSFFHHFNVFRRDIFLFNLLVIFVFLIPFPSYKFSFGFTFLFVVQGFSSTLHLSRRSVVLSQFVLVFVLSVRRNISFSSYPFFFVVRFYFLMKILFYIIFSSLSVKFFVFHNISFELLKSKDV